jgi:transcriptional regulator with XRE-family HTH domain
MPQNRKPFERLGQTIAQARHRARLSQPELAKLVGVSTGYIGHIEIGRNRPSPEVLRNLATVLAIEYEELAALAGFIDAQTGEVSILVPADNLSLRRQLATMPGDALRHVWTAITALQRLDDELLDDVNGTKDRRAGRPWFIDGSPDAGPGPAPTDPQGT